jgi:hypothetical protein
MVEGNWQELPIEDREHQLLGRLIEIEVQAADPVFSSQITRERVAATTPDERMKVDVKMLDRATELRDEGKMSPTKELQEKAREMASLNSDGLKSALYNFSERTRQKSQ